MTTDMAGAADRPDAPDAPTPANDPELSGDTGRHLRHAPDSLWRNRDFRTFLVGQGVSAFGDAVSFTALPLLVVLLTGSGVAMGLVVVLTTIPDLLVGLPAGALADRWDRRRLMLYADVGRAALTALIPLSLILELDTMAVILLVTAPINVLRVLFLAAWTGAMPNLVGREQVGTANGYAEAIFSSAFILGPALAGVLMATIGPAPTLALDALSFLASAIALVFVRRPLQAPRDRPARRMTSEIAEGVRFIIRHRTLRVAIAFWGVIGVVSAPLVPAVIFFLSVDRGESPESVGLVLSAYGLGFLIGSLLAARLARGPLGLIMLFANAGTSVFLASVAFVDAVPLVAAGAVGAGATSSLALISYITLRATLPPDELLGRVGSTARMVSVGLQPVGAFTGGVLLDLAGGRFTIVVIAVLVAAASAVFAWSGSLRSAVSPRGAHARA